MIFISLIFQILIFVTSVPLIWMFLILTFPISTFKILTFLDIEFFIFQVFDFHFVSFHIRIRATAVFSKELYFHWNPNPILAIFHELGVGELFSKKLCSPLRELRYKVTRSFMLTLTKKRPKKYDLNAFKWSRPNSVNSKNTICHKKIVYGKGVGSSE